MLSLLCLSLAVPVQDPTPLILEGDPTPDGFVVQFLNKMIVASDGSWVVGVNTTNTATGIDDYLLRDGVPFITPGDLIPGLGSGLDFYLDFDHAGAGRLFGIGWNGILEIAQDHVTCIGHAGHLGAHLVQLRRHRLGQPLAPPRQVSHRLRGACGEGLKELARRFLAHSEISHSRRNLAIKGPVAMARWSQPNG